MHNANLITLVRICVFVLIGLSISSCSTTDRRLLAQAASSGDLSNYARLKAAEYKRNPDALFRDLRNIKSLLEELRGNARDKWGDEQADMPGNDKYVKYTDDYKSKAIIDFGAGRITVETINASNYQAQLRQAVITTLLSTDDPSATDIFSDETPEFNGEPFLYGQVLDQDSVAIRYAWRAIIKMAR